ncbi:NepR family anti-sigma factor [Roseobacter sp.]|uniref:NepR family anti-sigma factor n=1 Tax=Roseobacter sp. TaxID=1907202 RepID=UPI0025EB47DB|nr:NepR family anti-sigma factor [Roseobacter sp.]
MTHADSDPKRESVIDENLKRVYKEALEEGVPDRFRDLLEELKKQDSQKGSAK